MSDSAEEPKLIIDEDWKTQVQREKEELKQKTKSQEEAQAGETGAGVANEQSPSAETAKREQQPEPPPPASLTLLVTTLATQAMAAMGLLHDQEDEPPEVNLDFAKHFVDTLSVLEEKTRGNLTDAEKSYLNDALHQLRMTFVAVTKQHRT